MGRVQARGAGENVDPDEGGDEVFQCCCVAGREELMFVVF